MRIYIEVGEVKIDVSDSDVKEPNTMRWDDQFNRAVKMLHEAKDAAVSLDSAHRGEQQ